MCVWHYILFESFMSQLDWLARECKLIVEKVKIANCLYLWSFLMSGMLWFLIEIVSSHFNLKTNIDAFLHSQIEPVTVDEIHIQLGGGPDGYRATFRNIEAYGVSNLTLTNIR